MSLKHRWCLERESYKSFNYGMENRDSVCKQFNSLYDAHSTDETIWTKSNYGSTELGSSMSSVLSQTSDLTGNEWGEQDFLRSPISLEHSVRTPTNQNYWDMEPIRTLTNFKIQRLPWMASTNKI